MKGILPRYPASKNLYQFIRMVLGTEISDREISRRWKMDIKNFILLKQGKLPPPRVERLAELSKILNVSCYFLCLVVYGMSADWVFSLAEEGEPIDAFQLFPNKTLGEEDFVMQFLERAPFGIFSFDRKGRILFWNKSCERIYNRKQEKMKGKNFVNWILPKNVRTQVRQSLALLFSKGVPFYWETAEKLSESRTRALFTYYWLVRQEGEKHSFAIALHIPLNCHARSMSPNVFVGE